jgi:hypothetical protein
VGKGPRAQTLHEDMAVNSPDLDYFRRRAAEERAAADNAARPDRTYRSAHDELADRYEAVVRAYCSLIGRTTGL